jgi:hypothetical protein
LSQNIATQQKRTVADDFGTKYFSEETIASHNVCKGKIFFGSPAIAAQDDERI